MEGRTKEAETMLKRSPAWRKWRGTLGEGTLAQLTAMGPIAWLTQQDRPPDPQQQQQQPPPDAELAPGVQ